MKKTKIGVWGFQNANFDSLRKIDFKVCDRKLHKFLIFSPRSFPKTANARTVIQQNKTHNTNSQHTLENQNRLKKECYLVKGRLIMADRKCIRINGRGLEHSTSRPNKWIEAESYNPQGRGGWVERNVSKENDRNHLTHTSIDLPCAKMVTTQHARTYMNTWTKLPCLNCVSKLFLLWVVRNSFQNN